MNNKNIIVEGESLSDGEEKNINKVISEKEQKKNAKDSDMEDLRGYVLEAINDKDDDKTETDNLDQDVADNKKNVANKVKQKSSVLLSGIKKISNVKINSLKGDNRIASELLKINKISKTKKVLKYLFFSLLVIIFCVFLIGMSIYYFKWENKFFDFLIEKLPIPVALVGSDFILFNDYNVVLAASMNSLAKEPEIERTAEMIDEIKNNILNRLIDIKMIDEIANKYNIFLTEDEINNSLDLYIKEAGSEEAFVNMLKDLYLWDLNDFKEKLLKPFLLENKLDSYLASSDDLNQDKKNQAERILSGLPSDISEGQFIEAVRQYSEDKTTVEDGGYLDSFGRGMMVKEFEDVAFSLPVGGISGVVRTAYGFHIIMVTDKNEEEGTIKARHILILARNLQDVLEEKRNETNITKLIK